AYLPGDYTYVSIDVGGASGCGVTTSSRLVCWGWNGSSVLGLGDTHNRHQPTMVVENNWLSVSIGDDHACGLRLRLVLPSPKVDQRYCWGNNNVGRLGDGTTTDRPTPAWVNDG